MLDRIFKINPVSNRHGAGSRHDSKQSRRTPLLEVLEGRQLMTASLTPIANLSVPALQGYQQPLDGSGTSDNQTFTATSSNPNIKVTVPQGDFWTITVSTSIHHTCDVSFNNKL